MNSRFSKKMMYGLTFNIRPYRLHYVKGHFQIMNLFALTHAIHGWVYWVRFLALRPTFKHVYTFFWQQSSKK